MALECSTRTQVLKCFPSVDHRHLYCESLVSWSWNRALRYFDVYAWSTVSFKSGMTTLRRSWSPASLDTKSDIICFLGLSLHVVIDLVLYKHALPKSCYRFFCCSLGSDKTNFKRTAGHVIVSSNRYVELRAFSFVPRVLSWARDQPQGQNKYRYDR